MKILWISNIPFGPLCELAGHVNSSSGGWLDAAFQMLKNETDIEFIIVTVGRVNKPKIKKEGAHVFCVLPGGYPGEYRASSSRNWEYWIEIRDTYKPDLIQIWGTEFSHGYLAMKAMSEIPSVIYMQGMVGLIARYYSSGISLREKLQSITLRDVIKLDWISRQQSKFYLQSHIESEMLKLSGNVIVENDWCALQCKAIAPNIAIHRSRLNIGESFFRQGWNFKSIEQYSILCSASGYPIKGLHVLLQALKKVIQKYPQTMLYVPGENYLVAESILQRLKMNGYSHLIKSLIKKLDLKNNVVFIGRLTPNQMAEKMASVNVFVMSSSIENHSSTLIEAMVVGTPCISSYAGGISEFLKHNANGLLYRFEEPEILAAHIIKIFDDKSFASKIGENGRNSMRDDRKSDNLRNSMISIYRNILSQKNV